MATTANNYAIKLGPGGQQTIESYIVQDTVTIYTGDLVGIDSTTGHLQKWADEASIAFVGVAVGGNPRNGPDNDGAVTGDTSASIPPEMNVRLGAIVRQVAVTGASAQTDVGEEVYASDEDTFDQSATTNTQPVGRIIRFHSSTSFDVQLYTPSEYNASI